MMSTHRTKPPRSEPWEVLDLHPDRPQNWLDKSWPVSIKNAISTRLKDSLLSAKVIRLFRSSLLEWKGESEWQCRRYLGQGGFGAVALWTRISEKNELQDEIVLKEALRRGTSCHSSGPGMHLAAEAYFQHILNRHNLQNITHLRGYKAIVKNELTSNPSIWRFYLEYAPYGDLGNLALRYKALDRYLPELFLWHVFNSLARAIQLLETAAGDNAFYLHFDIKPDNIFLGYEARRTQSTASGGLNGESVGYPVIQLGDFGLTWKVSESNDHPITSVHAIGTEDYQAPELLQNDWKPHVQYGAGWKHPPNKPDDQLTAKVNIWNVGKVMYDVFSLSSSAFYSYRRAQNDHEYDLYNRNAIPNLDTIPFIEDQIHQRSPYTKELSDLIEKCLQVNPSDRPTADELYDATLDELLGVYQVPESNLSLSVRNRRLYYRGNEINDMPIGAKNCDRPLELADYFLLTDPRNNDPDDPPLDVHPERYWEWHPELVDQHERRRNFEEQQAAIYEADLFQRRILQNRKRLRFSKDQIRFSDPDAALTYDGSQKDRFFINETNDIDGNDDNSGGPRPLRPEDHRPAQQTRSEKQGSNQSRTSTQPSENQSIFEGVSDGDMFRSRRQPPLVAAQAQSSKKRARKDEPQKARKRPRLSKIKEVTETINAPQASHPRARRNRPELWRPIRAAPDTKASKYPGDISTLLMGGHSTHLEGNVER